jgi:hypothetical protein
MDRWWCAIDQYKDPNPCRGAVCCDQNQIRRTGYASVAIRIDIRACGKRGADVRPDFNWNRKQVSVMGYR